MNDEKKNQQLEQPYPKHTPTKEKSHILKDGSILGQYKILSLLQVHSNRSIYKAKHNNLIFAQKEGEVALSVLHSPNPEQKKQFVQTAATGLRIVHPHILPVYSFSEEQDHCSMITMLPQGELLSEKIPPKGLSLSQTLRYLTPIAKVLDVLDETPNIHKYFHPQNIFVSPTQIYLGQIDEKQQSLYTAPEHVEGAKNTKKSLQYSLALMTHVLICGRFPWPEETPLPVIQTNKCKGLLETKYVKNKLSQEGLSILIRALSYEPQDRYDNCSAFVQALETISNTDPNDIREQLQSFIQKHSRVTLQERKTNNQTTLDIFLQKHPHDRILQEKGARLKRLMERFPQEPLPEWEKRIETAALQISQLKQEYQPLTPTPLRPDPQRTHPQKTPPRRGTHSIVSVLLALCTFSFALYLLYYHSSTRMPNLNGHWISNNIQYKDIDYKYVLEIQQKGSALTGNLKIHICRSPANERPAFYSVFSGSIAPQQTNHHSVSIQMEEANNILPQPASFLGAYEYNTQISSDGFFSQAQLSFVKTSPDKAYKTAKGAELDIFLKQTNTQDKISWCDYP